MKTFNQHCSAIQETNDFTSLEDYGREFKAAVKSFPLEQVCFYIEMYNEKAYIIHKIALESIPQFADIAGLEVPADFSYLKNNNWFANLGPKREEVYNNEFPIGGTVNHAKNKEALIRINNSQTMSKPFKRSTNKMVISIILSSKGKRNTLLNRILYKLKLI